LLHLRRKAEALKGQRFKEGSKAPKIFSRNRTEAVSLIFKCWTLPRPLLNVFGFFTFKKATRFDESKASLGRKRSLHPLKRITVLQKNWGFGDIFSFWFFIIKLFSELVALYFQTLLQKPS